MKICPDCKAENADSAKFCLVCGHLLTKADITEEMPGTAGTSEADTSYGEPNKPEFGTEEDRFEDVPETDAPKTDAPETDAPETEAPETEAPEADVPEDDAETYGKECAPIDLPASEEPAKDVKEAGLLKTWQYFLLEVLFALPLIGTVCLFIFSLSRPKNESLRRFSASRLIWRLILYILVFVLVAVFLIRFDHWAPRFAAFFDLLNGGAVH